jgi:hypothetical protein
MCRVAVAQLAIVCTSHPSLLISVRGSAVRPRAVALCQHLAAAGNRLHGLVADY